MLSTDYTKETGWQKPKIVPYSPIQMETSAAVLHHGISVHAGISVVENRRNGKLQAFRAKEQLQMFLESSEHLDMPTFNTNELMDCIKQLVILDKEWMGTHDERNQFYTRMVHFSTDETLGAHTSHATKLLVMLNPLMLK